MSKPKDLLHTGVGKVKEKAFINVLSQNNRAARRARESMKRKKGS